MTFDLWYCWLDVLGDALYEFMQRLYDASPDAYHVMNVGFDDEERRLVDLAEALADVAEAPPFSFFP